jgi:glycosyltransferase involved in cell wall biosynthesis
VMKVAHVIAGLHNPAAGTSYTVLQLADALARHGVAGQVHTLRSVPEHLSARPDIVGYPAVRIIRRLGISPAMRCGLASTAGDILHNHGAWMMPNIYAGMVARERRAPLVFAPRGMFSEWAMAFSRGRKRFAWWCLGQRRAVGATACFHATSEAEARDIRRLGFRQPIAVVPNGIALPDLGTEARSASRSERRKVLFLARIHPIKGIPVLLRSWQRVEHRYPGWELVVAGPDEGGHLNGVQALASELDLTRVSFPGPVFAKAKDEAYRSADLFVLPTHSENFGMAIAEALSYGLPVITTTGAPWQELETRDCGWWIELSEANLAEALRTAMDLPEDRRRQMGRRGTLWMAESYGWSRIAGEMRGVYEWVLGGGPPPSCVVTD